MGGCVWGAPVQGFSTPKCSEHRGDVVACLLRCVAVNGVPPLRLLPSLLLLPVDVLFSSPRGKGELSDGYENVIKSIAKPAESGAELAGGGGAARRFPSAFPGFEGSSAASAEVRPRCSRAAKLRLNRAGDPTPAHFSNFIHKRGQAQGKRRDPRSHPLFSSLPVAAAGSSPDPFLLHIFACSKAIGSLGPEWEARDSRLCDLQGRTAGGGAPHTREFRETPAPLRAQKRQGLRVRSFTPRRGLRGRRLCGPSQLGYPPPPGGKVFLFFQVCTATAPWLRGRGPREHPPAAALRGRCCTRAPRSLCTPVRSREEGCGLRRG